MSGKRFLAWLYRQPYLLLFLATLFWAGNAIAGKLAVGHISPFVFTSLRWLLASAIVIMVSFPHLKSDWQLIRPRLAFLFSLGLIGFTLFNNLMYVALQSTTAMNVAIIQAALPASIFILNFLIYRLRANSHQLIGFPITVLGVIAIIAQGQWQVLTQLSFVIGDLLMLVAITCYGVYSVMLTKKPQIHWLSLITVLAMSAFLASLPFVFIEIVNQKQLWPDQTGWIVVLYTAVFASLCSQVFWIRGLELIGSNAASLFINLVPVLGTFLAIVLLGESLYWYHVCGLLLIVGGITFAQRGKKES